MNRLKAFCLAGAVMLCGLPAFAGPLADDTNTFEGIWHHSTPFQAYIDFPNYTPAALAGHIDWAVYAPGTFPVGFTGYTPVPDGFVYAYQVFLDAGDPPFFFGVILDLFGLNIGTFTGDAGFGLVGGDSPISSYLYPSNLNPTSANWEFGASQSLLHSRGLAFNSPFPPGLRNGFIGEISAQGDLESFEYPIPLPSPYFVPEPSSFVLAALGLIGLVVWKRRKR